MRKNLLPTAILINIFFLLTTIIFISCKQEDDEDVTPDTTTTTDDSNNTTDEVGTKTITVGVYLLEGSTYTDSNKDLVFTTRDACQSWSRTAQADNHSNTSHDHFNAAKSVSYDDATSTITWTEFGPETTQESIDATCTAGEDGATKTANTTGYSQDKNFYLQIKTVE